MCEFGDILENCQMIYKPPGYNFIEHPYIVPTRSMFI